MFGDDLASASLILPTAIGLLIIIALILVNVMLVLAIRYLFLAGNAVALRNRTDLE